MARWKAYEALTLANKRHQSGQRGIDESVAMHRSRLAEALVIREEIR